MEFHENRPILSARPRINKDGNQGREIAGRYIVNIDIANEVWKNVLHGFSRRADVSAYLNLSPTGVCSRYALPYFTAKHERNWISHAAFFLNFLTRLKISDLGPGLCTL